MNALRWKRLRVLHPQSGGTRRASVLGRTARALFTSVCLVACAQVLELDELEYRDLPCASTTCDGGGRGGTEAGAKALPGGSTEPGGGGGRTGSVSDTGGAGASGLGGEGGTPPDLDAGAAGESGVAGDGGAIGSGGEGNLPCSTHQDCLPWPDGAPHMCLRARCVALTNGVPIFEPTPGAEASLDCRTVLGAENILAGGDPFLFGALAVGAENHSSDARNYELVVREFTAKGGVTIRGETRLPVLVVCNTGGSTRSRWATTFDHLVSVLDVPAIISPLPAADLKWAFEYVRRELGKPVFFMSPLASDSLLTTIADEGLLWHLLGTPQRIARTYVPLVRRVERHVRRALTPDRPLRLMLVDSTESFHADLAAFVEEALVFNDLSARDNEDAGRFRRLRLPPSEDPYILDSVLAAVEDVQAFEPDIIVSTGGYEFFVLMVFLDQERSQSASPPPMPFFVLSPQVGGHQRQELLAFLTVSPIHDRIAGVGFAAAEDPSTYRAYLSALNATFPDDTHLDSSENFYDAAYFLMHSAVAAGDVAPFDGHAIARGMQRLLAGPRFTVGAPHIPAVEMALATHPSIALWGTLGPPDWDVAAGAYRGKGSVYCLRPSPPGEHPAVEFVWDVLRYNDASGELEGTFPCIDGF